MTPPDFPGRIRQFLADHSGGITVESVVWIPIYGVFFSLIADVAIALNGKAQAQRALQDLNRLASYGYMIDTDEMESRGESILSHLSPNVVVTSEIDEDTNLISSVAVMPAEDLMPLGLLSAFADLDITVYSIHWLES